MSEENKRWVIYTEIISDKGPVERWFYGIYDQRVWANEVALSLDASTNDAEVRHCVCSEEEAESLGISNMP